MSPLRSIPRGWPSMVQVLLMAILAGVFCAFTLVRHRQASAAHPVDALAFSPDGRTLACSISRSVPPGLDGWLHSLLTRRTASGPTFHEVRLWDLETGGITTSLATFPTPVVCLAFSPDGKTLVTGGYKEWKAWDTSTWRCRATSVGLTQWVNSVAFSPDGSSLATTGQDMAVRLWDAHDFRERAVIDGAPSTFHSVAFSPDGKSIAAGSNGDGSVKLWDAETRQMRFRLYRGPNGVLTIAFSPDGRTLASGGTDNIVTLWDVATGSARSNLKGQEDWIESLVVSHDGKVLASASRDGIIKLWDIDSGNLISDVQGEPGHANPLALSPDGLTLATSSRGGFINLREAATGRWRSSFPGQVSWSILVWPLSCWAVAWLLASPGSRRLFRRAVARSGFEASDANDDPSPGKPPGGVARGPVAHEARAGGDPPDPRVVLLRGRDKPTTPDSE